MTVIVHVRHIREEMLCTRGMRVWLVHHGFDVSSFVRDGLPAETLEATGDEFAMRVSARARREQE